MARKKYLRLEQTEMSSSAYVNEAAEWSHDLVVAESRGPGDYDNAMQRVADRLGIAYRSLWALRYRKPKRVDAAVYVPLKQEAKPYEDRVADRYEALTDRIARLEAALRGAPADGAS